MKVALVHDYLVNKGGAERVVLSLHRAFPDAPIFTSIFHPSSTYEEFARADVRTSFLQRLSSSSEDFRRLLPLFPRAFRSMSFAGFDAVVVSSSAFAHHVRPKVPVITYLYAPPRFLWDERYDKTLAPAWARPALEPALAMLRRTDRRIIRNAGTILTCGTQTAAAIERVYGRGSTVLHPPVECDRFANDEPPGEGYVLVGRLLPHRNHEMAVEAFTRAQLPLTIVGDGPNLSTLRALAGPTITFAGAVDDREVERAYARSRGVVVPGVEDFGLVALEANASGRPVISLAEGGALETVRDGVTGVLFERMDAASLLEAVTRAEAIAWDPAALVAHARAFDETIFHAGVRAAVEAAL